MTLKLKTIAVRVFAFAAKEPFFIITLILTIVVSFFSKPHVSAIHWNVITTLFSLMLVCHAFDRCQLLSSLAGKALSTFKKPKKLGFIMIFATGALSMLITNDVALLAVVPLTMKMAKVSRKDPLLLIILETMAANLFSALTPFGNPQNLYLYSFFRIQPGRFLSMMVPFCLFGILLLVGINFAVNNGNAYTVDPAPFEIYDSRLLIGASVAFLFNILSVLRLIDYRFAFVTTLVIMLFLAPRLLVKVDYYLLLTFILFFLFTDSVTGIHSVRIFFTGLLNTKMSVFLVSAGLSQIISNVPAAVLLSGFTSYGKELLYGVSAGGLGTLVASLASLISYRYYVREYKSGRYIRWFSILNFGVLFLMTAGVAAMEAVFGR